jgi:polysaccharide biosynthesis/export protein
MLTEESVVSQIIRVFLLAVWVVATIAAPAPALAQASAAQPSSSAPLVSDPDYAIGEGDLVEVVVVGSPEYNVRARVASDGSVLLPLIGAVKAAGQSQATLSENVAKALKAGGYYANPIVRVELIGIRSRYAIVLGAVGSQGLVPLDRAYRLSELIARVGGKSENGADYIVVTPAKGASKRYAFDALATGGPSEDPVVQAGDKIYVPPQSQDVYYLTGEVKSPGPFPSAKDLTLRIALAKAGGLTENGSDKRVTVVRDGKTIKGLKLEDKVQSGDVITVGARLF